MVELRQDHLYDERWDDLLDVGEANMSRFITFRNTGIAQTTGQVGLVFWRAKRTETISKLAVYTAGTAAAATPTLCKMGLYLINGEVGTLVAQTASDTTLFAATNTRYERDVTPFTKVAGAKYATAVLIISGVAFPTFYGKDYGGGVAATILGRLPHITATLNGQIDLPTSFVPGDLFNSTYNYYMEILP